MLAVGLLAGPTASQATSCGTVAAPGACSIQVGGAVSYSFTNFDFVSNAASGGGPLFSGSDIAIDLVAGPDLSVSLTFSKVASDGYVVFFANPGQTTSFTFSYLLTATPLLPGPLEFTNRTTSGCWAPMPRMGRDRCRGSWQTRITASPASSLRRTHVRPQGRVLCQPATSSLSSATPVMRRSGGFATPSMRG